MKYKFGYLPSFGKELKALSKKYKSLKKDFEALKEEGLNVKFQQQNKKNEIIGMIKKVIDSQ